MKKTLLSLKDEEHHFKKTLLPLKDEENHFKKTLQPLKDEEHHFKKTLQPLKDEEHHFKKTSLPLEDVALVSLPLTTVCDVSKNLLVLFPSPIKNPWAKKQHFSFESMIVLDPKFT